MKAEEKRTMGNNGRTRSRRTATKRTSRKIKPNITMKNRRQIGKKRRKLREK